MRELVLSVPADAVEDVLDELLLIAPHGVFEVAAGANVELRLRAEAGELPDRAAVSQAAGRWAASLHEREVSDDWRERRADDHVPLVLAGRVSVRPPWAPAPGGGLIDIVLTDEQAFGIGGHPTTRACLELMCELEPGGALTDLGCGSGVLAIAGALLGWSPVVAIDREATAVVAAHANAMASGAAVQVRHGDVTELAAQATATLVANVPLIAHEAFAAALPTAPATLITAGVVTDHADRLAGLYGALGAREVRRVIRDGWALQLFTGAGSRVVSG